MTPARFPHSDTPGSTLGCQLPRAYRRLLRPSSALDAKASTTCPSQLVTHTTNPHHHTNPHTRNTYTRAASRRRQAVHTCNTPQKKHTHPRPQSRSGGTHKQAATPQQATDPAPKYPAHNPPQKQLQMLASTIQISNNNPTPTPPPTTAGNDPGRATTTPHQTRRSAGVSVLKPQHTHPQTISPASRPVDPPDLTGSWVTGQWSWGWVSDSSEPQQCVRRHPTCALARPRHEAAAHSRGGWSWFVSTSSKTPRPPVHERHRPGVCSLERR
jgi:hypothetical protein